MLFNGFKFKDIIIYDYYIFSNSATQAAYLVSCQVVKTEISKI